MQQQQQRGPLHPSYMPGKPEKVPAGPSRRLALYSTPHGSVWFAQFKVVMPGGLGHWYWCVALGFGPIDVWFYGSTFSSLHPLLAAVGPGLLTNSWLRSTCLMVKS